MRFGSRMIRMFHVRPNGAPPEPEGPKSARLKILKHVDHDALAVSRYMCAWDATMSRECFSRVIKCLFREFYFRLIRSKVIFL